MVKLKGILPALLGLFVFASTLPAADSGKVTPLKTKSSLSSEETDRIEQFVSQSIAEMFEAAGPEDIVKARESLLKGAPDSKSSQSYAKAFCQSLAKDAAAGMEDASRLEPLVAMQLKLNMMIAVANTGSVEIADFAAKHLESKEPYIAYWAAKALTSDKMASDASGSSIASKKLFSALEEHVLGLKDPYVLSMIIDFAGKVKGDGGVRLVVRIAEERLMSYQKWQVSNENLDARLLWTLAEKIKATSNAAYKKQMGWAYGQLYSYIIQRYIYGIENPDAISEISMNDLQRVIVDVDKVVNSRLIASYGSSQLKKAADERKVSALKSEHDTLLGSERKEGKLSESLGISYGKSGGGGNLTAPEKLKAPAAG